MKVAILSFYNSLVSRGVETFVTELADRIKGKVDLEIYHGDKLPLTGNNWHYLFFDPPSLAIRKFTLDVLHRFESNPPDIILALNNGWMSWFAKQFCQKHKSKLILAGFSGIGWDDKINLRLKPDCFIACSRYQAEWAKKINPQTRVETINIGVNTDRFKPEGKKFAHGLRAPVILVVAGPEKSKRVELAIKMANRVNASLLVVGRQPDKINRLGKTLLGKRFQNLVIGYNRLDEIYRSANVYTLPSGPSEAYGISILEALASGLPVVVNDDPIRRELVGDAGILTDPADLDKYALAIREAINQSKRNYRRQALKFSWDKIADQHLNLWLSLV